MLTTNTTAMTELQLYKINHVNDTPEKFGYVKNQMFVYVNKQSQQCFGSVNETYNPQTKKNELYFNHIGMEYIILNLTAKQIYKYK